MVDNTNQNYRYIGSIYGIPIYIKNMFKVGDKVKRINSPNCGLDIGDEFIIKLIEADLSYKGGYKVLADIGTGDRFHAIKNIILSAEQNKAEENKVEKYYKTLKDLPNLVKGAILVKEEGENSYKIKEDIWVVDNKEIQKYMETGSWNEADIIVENSPDWYERVYPVKSFKGAYYVVKSKLQEIMSKEQVNEDGNK
jgi:hypothetical protein